MLPLPPEASATLADAERKPRKLGLFFWLSIGWVALVIVLAVFAGVLPIPDPNAQRSGLNLNPSVHHLLGTDGLGRDMFARVVYAARVSLTVGFASIALGLAVGGTMGVIAGYYRGRIDRVLMAAVDVMLAFPALVFALAIVTFLGQNLRNVTIAIAVISIAPIARIVRASTLTFAQRDFVLAARTLGASNRRIILREILPNVAIPIGSFSFIAVALAVVGEGGLAFLGLSVHAPTATWGGMINDGRSFLQDHPNLSLIPSAVLFATVLALNFAGDTLRSRFDVKDVSV
ncbi:MAG TPA: ABC transporter permease [Acidimicrobiales bacterium]|nr:ABC transporter permease [Acidimicrobiales bacterium]